MAIISVSRTRPLALVALVACVAAASLGGCGVMDIAINSAARVGVAAYQERGVDGRTRDLAISSAVREALYAKDHQFIVDLSVTVYDGDVVLTGAVASEADRDKADRLARAVAGVDRVANELIVADPSTLDMARDTWISWRMDSRLLLDKEIDSVNYTVHTVDRTVYLIGIARDQDELDRVVAHAREIPHVKRIVRHVQTRDEREARMRGAARPDTHMAHP